MYYIAGIIKEDDGSGFSVYFPDVPSVCASGDSVTEAIENATDGLYEALRGMAEDNTPLPPSSDLDTVKAGVRAFREKIQLPYPDDIIYQYIPAPIMDMVPVRITVTIPKGILAEIDAHAKHAGMSRSGYLVAAAQAYAG